MVAERLFPSRTALERRVLHGTTTAFPGRRDARETVSSAHEVALFLCHFLLEKQKKVE